jgi:AAA domain
MFTPPNCKTLADLKQKPQIRLGIQGYPGTGKTWAALTFPNPIVVNFDRGLGAHDGRNDVIEVPFYDTDFIKSFYSAAPKNKRDAFTYWLETVGTKLESDQTLVIDGITGIQEAHNTWVKDNGSLMLSKTGKYDDFKPWNYKLDYFEYFAALLKTLKCHVILIAHETPAKEKDGTYTGKLRPLLSGQFSDQLVSHVTDWFRQHAIEKPKEIPSDEKLRSYGITKDEFVVMRDSFPRNTMYLWQTDSDDLADCKCSSLVAFPSRIAANYTSFLRYMRKPISATVVTG